MAGSRDSWISEQDQQTLAQASKVEKIPLSKCTACIEKIIGGDTNMFLCNSCIDNALARTSMPYTLHAGVDRSNLPFTSSAGPAGSTLNPLMFGDHRGDRMPNPLISIEEAEDIIPSSQMVQATHETFTRQPVSQSQSKIQEDYIPLESSEGTQYLLPNSGIAGTNEDNLIASRQTPDLAFNPQIQRQLVVRYTRPTKQESPQLPIPDPKRRRLEPKEPIFTPQPRKYSSTLLEGVGNDTPNGRESISSGSGIVDSTLRMQTMAGPMPNNHGNLVNDMSTAAVQSQGFQSTSELPVLSYGQSAIASRSNPNYLTPEGIQHAQEHLAQEHNAIAIVEDTILQQNIKLAKEDNVDGQDFLLNMTISCENRQGNIAKTRSKLIEVEKSRRDWLGPTQDPVPTTIPAQQPLTAFPNPQPTSFYSHMAPTFLQDNVGISSAINPYGTDDHQHPQTLGSYANLPGETHGQPSLPGSYLLSTQLQDHDPTSISENPNQIQPRSLGSFTIGQRNNSLATADDNMPVPEYPDQTQCNSSVSISSDMNSAPTANGGSFQSSNSLGYNIYDEADAYITQLFNPGDLSGLEPKQLDQSGPPADPGL